MVPRYSYPPRVIWALVRDAVLLRHRSFRSDALACVARLRPPLRLLGPEHIPSAGCFVVTPNHYYRRGFASQWTALAISASLPADVHWIMTGELTFPGSWIAPLGRPLSRFVLGRVSRVYDFTPMPPMPPRPREAGARAAAVRSVLHRAAHARDLVIGLAPEGGDQPAGRLSMPPSGVGRFCLLLAASGLRFLPVAVYEADGALTLRFGHPYELSLPGLDEAPGRDQFAASILMSHIAPLLPPELRGPFAAKRSSAPQP